MNGGSAGRGGNFLFVARVWLLGAASFVGILSFGLLAGFCAMRPFV
jgi:hypothetical protein